MLSHIAEQMLSRQDARLKMKEIKTSTHVQESSSGRVIQISPQIEKFPPMFSEEIQCQCPQQGLRADRREGEAQRSWRRILRGGSSQEEDLQSRRIF